MIMNMIQFWVQDNFLKKDAPLPETDENIEKRENSPHLSDTPKIDVREINNVVVNVPPYTGPQIEIKG